MPQTSPATTLILRVRDQAFSLDAACSLEIRRAGSITRLPGAPAALRGLTNFRGQVVPVFDIAAGDAASDPRMLFVHHNACTLALIVDQVDEADSDTPSCQPLDLDSVFNQVFSASPTPA